MNTKQSQICNICQSYMQFVKNNEWLKCPTCGEMKKISKRIIKVLKKCKMK